MVFKTKGIGLLFLALFLTIGISTQLFSNLWNLFIKNSCVIPNQSSIFTFKSLISNKDSDGCWLYGEDQV